MRLGSRGVIFPYLDDLVLLVIPERQVLMVKSPALTKSDATARYAIAALFAAVLAVYILTLVLLYPALPVIARQADTIPGYDTHYPPFRVDEYNYNVIAKNLLNGNLYADNSLERSYTVGYPLVAAPFIALMGDIGGYVANALIIWAALIVFYCALRRHMNRSRSVAVTLLLAFATLNWFYAASGYTEPLAQLFLILSFFLLMPSANGGRRLSILFLSGALAGLNLFVRTHYILLTAPFFLYLLADGKRMRLSERGAWMFAAGATVVAAVWILRNTLVFGGPLTFEYTRLMDSYIPGAASDYMKGNVFLGTHRLLFDQYHGLLTITPVLLLFPVGLRSMWNAGLRRESILLLVSVAGMALFAAAGAYPFTEFGLGSRHMLPVIPLMVFPVAWFLDGRLFTRSVVIVLAVYSLYHAGIGWFTGGEPGRGFFLGILNESQARAVILARKNMLPKKHFASEEELIRAYRKALDEVNLMKLLQTLDPLVIEKIQGNERTFMLFLRSQPNPLEFILSADPARGIIIKSFSISGGLSPSQPSHPDSTR